MYFESKIVQGLLKLRLQIHVLDFGLEIAEVVTEEELAE
jgi:hypothetical protein